MEKKITIRIKPDGSIQATTQGIKGNSCLKYMSILENLTKSEIVDSEYTEEFYEHEEELQVEVNNQKIRMVN